MRPWPNAPWMTVLYGALIYTSCVAARLIGITHWLNRRKIGWFVRG